MAVSAIVTVRRLLALATFAVLAACTVVVEEGPPPGPGAGPRPEPQYCTREYRPVCARRGPNVRTFANGCLAEQAGYNLIRYGECRPDPTEEEPRFCTREYRPVCAQRGPRLRTFGNACEADVAGYRVVDYGPC